MPGGYGVLMEKNYYESLGVDPDADMEDIRKAYRKLVRQCHPDVCSDMGHDRFVEVKEAYEVLSDPEKRRRYDVKLACESRTGRRRPVHDSRFSPSYGNNHAVSEVERMVDSMFEQFFDAPTAPIKEFDLEVILTFDEALKGGRITVDVPIFRPCPKCAGDYMERFFCTRCSGMGGFRSIRRTNLIIPPNVRSGTLLQFPIRHQGVVQKLKALVRVEE
jgi:DnaJ-class molecular chaperone